MPVTVVLDASTDTGMAHVHSCPVIWGASSTMRPITLTACRTRAHSPRSWVLLKLRLSRPLRGVA
jgi:hypothetical protein